ncbi:MAG: ComEA family DNA-binding protein [Clostridia bacterium]|nr:ComEA family DNA-binding protein [Clostridia bacterium]
MRWVEQGAGRPWAAVALMVAALGLGLLAWRAAAAMPADPLGEWNAAASEVAPPGGAPGSEVAGAGPGSEASEAGATAAAADGAGRPSEAFGPYSGWRDVERDGQRDVAVVDVAGAVRSPGVYILPAGARVWDAVKAAGGAAADAQLSAVNLAEPVSDGQQVYIPRKGETVAGRASAAGGSGPAKVDINHAGADVLEALPGIGPELAERIVKERQAHGPFRSVDDLARVSGIGPKKLEALRPLIVIR